MFSYLVVAVYPRVGVFYAFCTGFLKIKCNLNTLSASINSYQREVLPCTSGCGRNPNEKLPVN